MNKLSTYIIVLLLVACVDVTPTGTLPTNTPSPTIEDTSTPTATLTPSATALPSETTVPSPTMLPTITPDVAGCEFGSAVGDWWFRPYSPRNLRSGPGLTYPIIGGLFDSVSVSILCSYTASETDWWFRITTTDQTGWVAYSLDLGSGGGVYFGEAWFDG